MAAKANELEIVRVYDAPVELVWDAWTDPEKIAKWWGPRGFTHTTKSKDFRPGGKWIYTMHGPDGVDWPNMTTYHVIEKYKKLVYDHGGNDERPKLFTVTVTFAEEMGKTIMTMIMALDTPEAAKEIKKFIKSANGDATWDRLAEFLDKQNSGKESFIIHRSFEAPITKIFEMFSKPEHVGKWQPPAGFKMKYVNAEIKSGGTALYYVSPDDVSKDYVKTYYYEVTPNTRIVSSQQFVNADGSLSRHSSAPTWPESMLTYITFAEEGPNQTRVTLKWEGAGTNEEIAAFAAEKGGMTLGWSGSFDQLEKLLN